MYIERERKKGRERNLRYCSESGIYHVKSVTNVAP